jgi:hypothetical protein
MSTTDAPVKKPSERPDRDRFQDAEKPVVLDEVEASQAVTGHNVRYVLGFGLAGVVIAFAAILLFNFVH